MGMKDFVFGFMPTYVDAASTSPSYLTQHEKESQEDIAVSLRSVAFLQIFSLLKYYLTD